MSVLASLEFQPMLIPEVFESLKASAAWYDKNKVVNGIGMYPYVSRSAISNGYESVVGHQDLPPNPGNAITIGVDTQTVFYQPTPFYTSVKIQVLRHPQLNMYNGLVLVTLLRRQMVKFQWGNGASLDRLRATRIMVPVTQDGDNQRLVDWEGMTLLGQELREKAVAEASKAIDTQTVDTDELPHLEFQPRLITEVFEHTRQAPSWLNTNKVRGGTQRFAHVTNSAASNSVAAFIAHQEKRPNPGNAITIGIDTQVVAYQPAPFYGATKVFELRSPYLNKDNALILVTLLKAAVRKFSWGYKASATRLKRTRIMVPVRYDLDGTSYIDWEGMSEYGRSLRARAERNLSPALQPSLPMTPGKSLINSNL